MTTTKKAALKVHQLAKELGVNSKDIVAKCQVEEIPDITTHLSPVSIGLAQTIREWFSGHAVASGAEHAHGHEHHAEGHAEAQESRASTQPAARAGHAQSGQTGSHAGSDVTTEEAPRIARKAAKKPVDAAATTSTAAGHENKVDHPTRETATPAAKTATHSEFGHPPHESKRDVMAEHAHDRGVEHGLGAKRDTHAGRSEHQADRPADRSADTKAHERSGAVDHKPTARTEATPTPKADQSQRDSQHDTKSGPRSDGGLRAETAAATPHAPSKQPHAPAADPTATKTDAPVRPARAPGVPSPIPSAMNKPAATPAAPARPATPSHRPGVAASASAGPPSRDRGTARPPARTGPQTDPRTDAGSRDSSSGDDSGAGGPPVMNVPKRPDNVIAAGPKLQSPIKSAMSGPKVIRIEAPEQLPAPRPRSATGGTGGPMRVGRVGGASGAGRPDDRRGGAAAGRGGRRDETGRSGRLARAGGGPATGGPAVPGEPWRDQDLRERSDRLSRSGGFFKDHRRESQRKSQPAQRGGQPEHEPIRVSEPITIKELSAATGVKAVDILRKLFLSGTVATINSAIDSERAMEIMFEFDIELLVVESKSAAEIIEARFTDREKVDVRPRAPVVTILGHVDHGKTSLLDKIRNANVASGEAGGITQATSAFQVPVKTGERDRVVTFIDTPGHEAFTNMRARGAKVTDIVVLVIAADDGVMPQTVESINHAKAAGVPIVVALNKIDKPEATESNIRRILGQLAEHELNPTEWGGTTEVIRTSATKGEGIQDLIDILDYQADLLGLTADFGGAARGTVLEAKMEEGRGPVANVVVQEGTLKKGDFIVVGRGFGRVRDIVTDRGVRGQEAIPSTPVAISGIDQLPDAGDKFYVVDSLKAAEQAAEERRRLDRERELAAPKITLDNIFAHLEKGQRKELSLVVKGDVQGSVETLRAVLQKISTDEVAVGVRHCAVGGINESDIALAEATKSIIVGFNVTSSSKARNLAEAKGIEIRLYDVIYDLTDDVTKAASGLLAPELKLEVLGHAEVRQAFRISKVGMIAGCYVLDGTIERNAQIRVTRGGIVIEKDRRLEQLKRFKDDAKDVRAGQECGMKIVGYDDIKVGDVLECYRTISVARNL